MTSPSERRQRRVVVSQQNAIPVPLPLPFPHPADPLPANEHDPFIVAGSSRNIDGPALTPGTSVANIRAQLANGPQLAQSFRPNAAAQQPPVAVGRAAVAALFAQAALIPAPPPPNRRRGPAVHVFPPLPALPLHIGRARVGALQGQAAALPLQQAPLQYPHAIPAPPILPLDPVPVPPIVPIQMAEGALPLPLARRPINERAANTLCHYLGNMTVVCPKCNALHWMAERLSHSSNANPLFGGCCLSGKIRLPLLEDVPQTLRRLLESPDDDAKEFRKNIRTYNSALAFTSLGAIMDRSLLDQERGPYVFKLHGELRHNHGSLIPNEGQTPSYAQLYFYEPDVAFQHRHERNKDRVNATTLSALQEIMLEFNPFVRIYKQAMTRLRDQPITPQLQVRLTYKAHTDPRRYNIPAGDDLAVILPGDGTSTDRRDIVLNYQGGGF
jgi:hypothetical protein